MSPAARSTRDSSFFAPAAKAAQRGVKMTRNSAKLFGFSRLENTLPGRPAFSRRSVWEALFCTPARRCITASTESSSTAA